MSEYDPSRGPRDRSLRVGDEERDAVAEILRQRHVEGRIDADEFQERLERSMTAKTYAELDVLIADFPRAAEPRRRRARQPYVWTLMPLPLLFLLFAVTAVAVGHHGFWLPLLLFFFVVRPLFWRCVR